MGLTTVETPETSEVPDTISFLPYNETLPECIAGAKRDGAQAIILLSHLG